MSGWRCRDTQPMQTKCPGKVEGNDPWLGQHVRSLRMARRGVSTMPAGSKSRTSTGLHVKSETDPFPNTEHQRQVAALPNRPFEIMARNQIQPSTRSRAEPKTSPVTYLSHSAIPSDTASSSSSSTGARSSRSCEPCSHPTGYASTADVTNMPLERSTLNIACPQYTSLTGRRNTLVISGSLALAATSPTVASGSICIRRALRRFAVRQWTNQQRFTSR